MAISAATVAGITAVMSVVGGAVTAYTAIQQGQAAKDQANAQAKAQQMEGEIRSMNARAAAAEHQKEAARVQSSQIASAAGAGIDLESESLLTMMADTANKYNMDAEQMRRTGLIQQSAATYSAGLTSAAGKNAVSGSYFKAGSSLLDGLATGVTYGNKAGWFD